MKKRRQTKYIVVHCSATPPASDIGADEIDDWHRRRGFDCIGYHAVIRRNGIIEWGRHPDAVGAAVKGHNYQSVNICLVGGLDAALNPENNFSASQMSSLRVLLATYAAAWPAAKVLGHRDLSPDQNGDGIITSDEWLKDCPCFDVRRWLYGKGVDQ